VHPKVKQQQQLHPWLLTLMRTLRTYMATVCLLPQFQYLAPGPDRWVSPLWQTPPKAKQSKAKQSNGKPPKQASAQTDVTKKDGSPNPNFFSTCPLPKKSFNNTEWEFRGIGIRVASFSDFA
jgi:hypothetical protein